MTKVRKMVSAERPRKAPVASIRKRIATYLVARLERQGKSPQFAIPTKGFLEHSQLLRRQ